MRREKTSNAKRFFIVLLTMIAMMAVSHRAAAISQFPDMVVTLINQEPDPVAPGNTVDVRFRIENQGSDPAKDVQIKLILSYPFTLYSGEQEIKNIGTVEGYQTDTIGVREKWKLLADSKAATGDNFIEFWYKLGGGEWTKAGEYAITVRSRNAVLAINQIKVDQDAIVPGTKTKVSFVLENMADNSLQDIKLNLGLRTELTTATSITISDLPFTPIDSGNERTLKSISPGESKEISFELFTDADATSKVYKVPYTITYSDTSGSNFTNQGIAGLLVDSNPELGVNIETTEIYSAGMKGKIELKLVNKGFSDIKFLDVKLANSESYDLLTNPEVYIGKLESDDYDTADFTLLVSSTAKDSIMLPVHVEYRDANGHLFSKDLPLELKLYSGAELKKRTNGKSASPLPTIIVIVIIAAGVFIYIKRKKKNKK
jgi:hypothetical protein